MEQQLGTNSRRDPSHMSRIIEDLRQSPHHPSTPVNGAIPNMLGRFANHATVPHICIVGGGLAGLRCADVLLQSSRAKVTILEGRNRLGGRLGQARVGKHLVDLGPNWIHGNKNNPISTIAKETGTITTSHGDDEEEEKELVMDSEGHPMPMEKTALLSDRFWGLIVQAFQYSNDNSKTIPKEKSLLDYLKEKLNDAELSTEDKKTVLEMASIWGCFVGDPIQRQSLKFFFLEECVEGGSYMLYSLKRQRLILCSK
jgi:monoamine oxidase